MCFIRYCRDPIIGRKNAEKKNPNRTTENRIEKQKRSTIKKKCFSKTYTNIHDSIELEYQSRNFVLFIIYKKNKSAHTEMSRLLY